MEERKTVGVITPTIADPLVREAVASVATQTYPAVQHLVVVDGAEFEAATRELLDGDSGTRVMVLPENTGHNRFNGHRVYASVPHLLNTDYIAFLDQDNWFDPTHIESLVALLEGEELDFAYCLRKIVSPEGEFLINDDCESLGKWPVFGNRGHHIDTSCYLFRRDWLIRHCHLWHDNHWHTDRNFFTHVLENLPETRFACTGEYSLNYRLGSTANSVKREFFEFGNAEQRKRYGEHLPWRKSTPAPSRPEVPDSTGSTVARATPQGTQPSPPSARQQLRDLLTVANSRVFSLSGQAALLADDVGRMAVLPHTIAHLLSQQDRFKTREELVDALAEPMQMEDQGRKELDSTLAQLQQMGLLASAEQLHDQVLKQAADADADLPADWVLGIGSCDRPALLERLFHNMEPYLREMPHPPELVFVDDSRRKDSRRRNRALVEQLAARLDLRYGYYDRAERSQFAQRLATAHPSLESSILWLLSPSAHPEDAGTYGLGKNFLQLHARHRPLLMLDDDALLDAILHPNTRPGLVARRDPRHMELFDRFEDVLQTRYRAGINPFREHLACLGRRPGELFTTRNDSTLDPDLWRGTERRDWTDWLAPQAHVGLTTNAIAGAQHSRSMEALYTLSDSGQAIENFLARMTPDTRKEQLSWLIIKRDNINRDLGFVCTTLSGIANGELPAPSFPVGRSEDLFMGDLSTFLNPGALHYRFRWALPHRPDPPRYWHPFETQPAKPGYTEFLYRWLLDECANNTRTNTPAERLEAYAGTLKALSGTPTRELSPMLVEQLLGYHSTMMARLNDRLAQFSGLEHYAAGLKRQIQLQEQAISGLPQQLETIAGHFQEAAGRFQAALRDWPQILALAEAELAATRAA